MSDNSIMYHCLCGWHGESLPTEAWICPTCGDVVGATTIEIDVPEIWTPAQFVFSRSQLVERPFPPEFWESLARRVIAGEITVDPRDLSQGLLPYIPVAPPRRPPGAPRGPRAFLDREDFEATLRAVISWLEKTFPTVPKWRIANAMHRLAQQPPDQRQDLQRALQRTDHLRPEEAARSFLRRCGTHFRVNIDVLIDQIRHELHDG